MENLTPEIIKQYEAQQAQIDAYLKYKEMEALKDQYKEEHKKLVEETQAERQEEKNEIIKNIKGKKPEQIAEYFLKEYLAEHYEIPTLEEYIEEQNKKPVKKVKKTTTKSKENEIVEELINKYPALKPYTTSGGRLNATKNKQKYIQEIITEKTFKIKYNEYIKLLNERKNSNLEYMKI